MSISAKIVITILLTVWFSAAMWDAYFPEHGGGLSCALILSFLIGIFSLWYFVK